MDMVYRKQMRGSMRENMRGSRGVRDDAVKTNAEDMKSVGSTAVKGMDDGIVESSDFRLSALGDAIATASQPPSEAGRYRSQAGMLHLGWRFVGEMFAGIAVGGFIGWWLDEWFSQSPLFLLIMLFLGMIGGLMNALRTIKNLYARETDDTGDTNDKME